MWLFRSGWLRSKYTVSVYGVKQRMGKRQGENERRQEKQDGHKVSLCFVLGIFFVWGPIYIICALLFKKVCTFEVGLMGHMIYGPRVVLLSCSTSDRLCNFLFSSGIIGKTIYWLIGFENKITNISSVAESMCDTETNISKEWKWFRWFLVQAIMFVMVEATVRFN